MLASGPRREGDSALTGDTSGSYSPPAAFGRFQVLHQIGSGVLGPVFLARDADRRSVAIKVFRLDITPEQAAELAAQLSKLARANLEHPAIVSAIAAGVEGTVAYLAEEYIGADSLDTAIRQYGPAPPSQALRVLAGIAGALDFAAVAHVHHGSLHPRDLLVSPSEIRVTGIGIARALESIGMRAPIRRPYTAPERVQREAWDSRADVYSIGVLAREMLLGRMRQGEPEAVSKLAEQAALVEPVLQKATAARPADRFATTLDLVAEIQAALSAARASPGSPKAAREVAAKPAAPPLVADLLPLDAAEREAGDGETRLPAAPAEAVHEHGGEVVDLAPLDRAVDGGGDVPALEPADARVDADSLHFDLPGTAPAPSRADLDDLSLGEFEFAPEPRYRQKDQALLDLSSPDRHLDNQDAAPPQPQPAGAENETMVPAGRQPASRLFSSIAGDSDGAVDLTPATQDVNEPRAHGRSYASLVVVLVVGVILGIALGYGLASYKTFARNATPGPVSRAQVAERQSPTTPASQSPSGSGPPGAGAAAATPGVVSVAPPSPAATPTASTAVPPTTGGAAPPATEASTRPGRLVIRSTPKGASVSIDGQARGTTPVSLRHLPLGRYAVSIGRRGYATEERDVTLTDKRPDATVTVTLSKGASREPAVSFGSISVDSTPSGSQVFLDGELAGTTPVVINHVAVGSHVVRLDHVGFQRWKRSVQVKAGQQRSVTASLEKAGR